MKPQPNDESPFKDPIHQELPDSFDERVPPPPPETLPSSPPPKKKVLKALTWTLRGGSSLLALLALVWVIFYFVATVKSNKAIHALRKAGYATRWAEMSPLPVPDDENAGPIYFEALAIHHFFEGDPDLELGFVLERGFSDLGLEEKKQVRKHIEKYNDVFSKLDEARLKPKCRFYRDYSLGGDLVIPDLSGALNLSKVLAVHAQSEALAGRHHGALRAVDHLIALAKAYKDEPLEYCQLVRLIILGRALKAVDACVTPETGVNELRDWYQLIPSPRSLDGAAKRALSWHSVFGAQIAENPVGNRIPFENCAAPPGVFSTSLMLPYLKLSGTRHVKLMRRAVDASGKPYMQARAELSAMDDGIKKAGILDFLSTRLFRYVTRNLDRQVNEQARIVVVRTGLEFEIERVTTGSYPTEVKALDPFTGKPLEYCREEGKILSAGPPDLASGETRLTFASWTLKNSTKK